jgi:hypothetical protein
MREASDMIRSPLTTTGSFLILIVSLLQAQEGESPVPGTEKTGKTKALEAGAELLQRKGPINAIHAHVCGFHFYNGDIKRQLRADHYCSHLNEEVIQCVIYDSDSPNARLIGIEYIISENLFKKLPEEEKKLWHSHQYEVMSGQLVAPGIPEMAERELMQKLVTTYGKTWHTWQVDRGDTLPIGLPKLMMGFTADGQANPELVEKRDKDLKINSEKIRRERAKTLKPGEIAPGADAWEKGDVFQLNDDLLKSPTSAEH